MTPGALKKIFEHDFAAAGIETPAVDAARLISEVSGIPELEMFLHPERELDDDMENTLRQLAARRCSREPLQYITGKAYFRDIVLDVDPHVLIPRPETELLVDFVINKLPVNGRLLDIGTGSGTIAVSTAVERRDVRVTAVDVSYEALQIAERNAEKYGVEIRFIESDLFSALAGERFDVISANLPYVTEDEYKDLAPEVRLHEPVLALVAADDGFELIRRTADALSDHLFPGGSAIFELAPAQAPRLQKLLQSLGFVSGVIRDLAGRDRFVTAEKK